MQMVGFFASRIVVVSGGGLSPSALSRAATLQNSAVEAPQHPAISKSRRFVCIGTSSKSVLTVGSGGAECRSTCFAWTLRPRWTPQAYHEGRRRSAGDEAAPSLSWSEVEELPWRTAFEIFALRLRAKDACFAVSQ